MFPDFEWLDFRSHCTVGIWKHLKSRLFEGRISSGGDLAMAIVGSPDDRDELCDILQWMIVKHMAIAIVPTIQNPDVFVRNSNGF